MKTLTSLWSLAALSLFINTAKVHPLDPLTAPENCITLSDSAAPSLEDILSSSNLLFSEPFPEPLRHARETEASQESLLDTIKIACARVYGKCLYLYYRAQQLALPYKKQQGK